MSHKYAHVKNLQNLEDEMLKLKLKKTIIRNEFSLNAHAAKDAFLNRQYLFSLLLKAIGGRKKKHAAVEPDGLDRLSHYTAWASNILELVNSLRK